MVTSTESSGPGVRPAMLVRLPTGKLTWAKVVLKASGCARVRVAARAFDTWNWMPAGIGVPAWVTRAARSLRSLLVALERRSPQAPATALAVAIAAHDIARPCGPALWPRSGSPRCRSLHRRKPGTPPTHA